MALIFADGFDNYDTLTDFWDSSNGNCSINTTPGAPRTGRGCMQISAGAFGPIKTFGHKTHLLACTSWNSSKPGFVLNFIQTDSSDRGNVTVVVNGDGSITFSVAEGQIVTGSTAPGLVTFGTYVSIAVEVENFTATTGIITCWVNGVQCFHQTGLRTAYDVTLPYCNGLRLMGPGQTAYTCYHDDFYLLDCSTAPNNTFLGALKLYAIPPTANAAVAWTPLAGSNWSEVDEVPPDGDTSYNSSATPGQIDQYVYPLTGPPAGSSILFVQHELDMEVDSGSRSVASDLGGVVAATATALSNGYHIYPTPYDVNPSTGVAFVAGDFPIQAGPKVTA